MTVSAITGTTISSMRMVETTMRWPCCAATIPDGCSSTVLQPASNEAGSKHNARTKFEVDMSKCDTCIVGCSKQDAHNLGVTGARGHWTFCPIAANLAKCDAARCRSDFGSCPTHQLCPTSIKTHCRSTFPDTMHDMGARTIRRSHPAKSQSA